MPENVENMQMFLFGIFVIERCVVVFALNLCSFRPVQVIKMCFLCSDVLFSLWFQVFDKR